MSRLKKKKSHPQRCTENIHSRVHKNVNNYKYSSCVRLMSQTRCQSWLTLWEWCHKAIIIMFCLNQSEWVDLSLHRTPSWAQHSDIGIYSHYWNDCWHVLLNKTRVNRALMWGTNEDEQMRVPDGDSLSLFVLSCNYGLSFFTLYFQSAVVFSFFLSFFFWRKEEAKRASMLLDWMSCSSSE